jgi:hypothetical protein
MSVFATITIIIFVNLFNSLLCSGYFRNIELRKSVFFVIFVLVCKLALVSLSVSI